MVAAAAVAAMRGRLRLRPQFQRAGLVVFDKDGTLISWTGFNSFIESLVAKLGRLELIRCPDGVFEAIGYDPASRIFAATSPVLREPVERGMLRFAAEAWRQRGGTGEVDDAFREQFVKLTSEGPEGNIWVVDLSYLTEENLDFCGAHVRELLEALLASGVKIGICTSDVRATTIHSLRVLKLDEYVRIHSSPGGGGGAAAGGAAAGGGDGDGGGEAAPEDGLVCADDAGVGRKPLPDGVEKLARLAGVPVEQVVMVGDSFSDILAGLRAGCRELVFVEAGGHSTEELDAYLRSPAFLDLAEAENLGPCAIVRVPAPKVAPASTPETTAPRLEDPGAGEGENRRVIYAMASVDGMLCEAE